MWTWALNWGEITPQIVVGSCPMTPDDLLSIQTGARVSAVLSVQHDECLAYWGIDYNRMRLSGATLGLAMNRCPIRDFDIADQRRRLPYAISVLARLQADGHRTYVHCTAGLGRSPLTVLGYLTFIERQSSEYAIRLIHEGRAGAVPAWEAYYGCREDLVTKYRSQIEQRAYELYEDGTHGNKHEDWRKAEAEVIGSALLAMNTTS